MRNYTIIIILLTLISCQSNTYYAAQNTNQKRFDGWNKEDADFLMETHDLVLLSDALSATAEKRANLKETYVLAKDIQIDLDELFMKFKLEAAVKRVKLASALSQKSDEQVKKLESINKENFDHVYFQYMKSDLAKAMTLAETYIKEGHTDRLKEFARTLKNTLEPILERLETTEIS